jgi:hypothetical protein
MEPKGTKAAFFLIIAKKEVHNEMYLMRHGPRSAGKYRPNADALALAALLIVSSWGKYYTESCPSIYLFHLYKEDK